MPTQTVVNTAGQVVPSAYSKMGVSHGWSPTPVQRLRIFLSSDSGVGKTNFVMSNPRALIIDTEDTATDVVRPKASHVWKPTMKYYLPLLEKLVVDGHNNARAYDHIVFDTFDRFTELAIQHLSAELEASGRGSNILEFGSSGAGWYRVRDFVIGWLNQLYMAGYGWTVVGHLTEKVDEHGNHYKRPSLPPSIQSAVYREAQLVTHLYRTTEVVKVPTGRVRKTKVGKHTRSKPVTEERTQSKVYMEISSIGEELRGPLQEVKARYLEHMPAQIRLPLWDGWSRFEKAYQTAIDKHRQEMQTVPSKDD